MILKITLYTGVGLRLRKGRQRGRTAEDMEDIGDIASDKVWVAAGTRRYRNRESDMEVAGQQRIWRI